jgi:hypothetical protein
LAFRQVAIPNDRPLLVQLVNGGKIVGDESPCGERHLRARAGPPLEALKMSRGEPVIETVFPGIGEGMEILTERSPGANCAQRAAWEMRSLGQPGSCEP